MHGTELKCEILIPLRFGKSGKPIDRATMMDIVKGFNRQFGGHTPLGRTGWPSGVLSDDPESDGGGWVDPDTGETINDTCILVRIYVKPEDLPLFEETAYSIGKRLEQKEMLIDIGERSGKFLKIIDEEGNIQSDAPDDDRQGRLPFGETDETAGPQEAAS